MARDMLEPDASVRARHTLRAEWLPAGPSDWRQRKEMARRGDALQSRFCKSDKGPVEKAHVRLGRHGKGGASMRPRAGIPSRRRTARWPARQADARREAVAGTPAALEENVEEIREWERASLLARSRTERISDWIAATAASGPALVLHVIWFAVWIILNTGVVPGVRAFDRFPFPFLTMTVSLEAIFLALFVLASQNRMARQSEMRSNLDLQIDLLAEREMTAVLQLLQDIVAHLGVSTSVTAEQIRDLASKTDVHSLTNRMEELTEPDADSQAQRPARP